MKNLEYSEARGYNLGIAREIGLEAAVTFNQLLFWQKIKGKNQWFYKTYDDIKLEIPLSEYQLRKAYRTLKDAGYIDTKLVKENKAPTLHFKIVKSLRIDTEETSETMDTEETSETINNKTHNKTHISDSDVSRQIADVYRLYLKQIVIPTRLNNINNVSAEKLLEMAERRYKLTAGRKKKIQSRLQDAGYKMVCAAIVGYASNPWYRGENESGWYAKLAEFICRSYETVEEGANKYEQFKQGKNTNDPWANL